MMGKELNILLVTAVFLNLFCFAEPFCEIKNFVEPLQTLGEPLSLIFYRLIGTFFTLPVPFYCKIASTQLLSIAIVFLPFMQVKIEHNFINL